MKTIYKPITLADLDGLMLIENSSYAHPWSEQTFASCIGGRYIGEFLCEDNTEQAPNILGFFVGEYVIGEATLMDLCICPKHQGQGNGRKLLTQFLSVAKKLGAEKAFLEVRASNIKAQMLYINEGFTQIDRRLAYYPCEVGYEDALVMVKNKL